MKLPGRAWLEFEVEPHGKTSLIRQTAIFDPIGLAGLAYWYGLYLFHRLIFAKMLGRIAEACQEKPGCPITKQTMDENEGDRLWILLQRFVITPGDFEKGRSLRS